MKISLSNILFNSILDLWNLYELQQKKGLKKEASNLLTEFINRISELETATIQKFVFYLTDLHRTQDYKIDFRLFKTIIFPSLISAIKLNELTANRRFAQFDQLLLPQNPLFKDLKKQLDYKNIYFEKRDFYEKELQLNIKDQIAIEGILYCLASNLNYATHEMPEFGLLCGIEHFQSELEKFKTYLEFASEKEKWLPGLEYWRNKIKT